MPNMIAFGIYNESDIWFKAAKELGYKVFAVSPHLKPQDELYKKNSPYLEEVLNLEYSDLSTISKVCSQKNIMASLCLPCTNDALIWQARLNSLLNFKGLQKKTAELCCDKLRFHEFLEEYKLPRARKTMPATLKNIKEFNFPFVVKPIFGAGGIGVDKILDQSGLDFFFLDQSQKSAQSKKEFIFQSFVGAKYHVGLNCVVKNKKLKVLAFNVRNLENEKWAPFFTENIFPSDDIDFICDKNISLLQELVDLIGLDNWPLKIEVFMNSRKEIIAIIEINLRPGGTRSPIAFSKVLGYDYALEQVKLCSPKHESFFESRGVKEFKYLMIKNFRFKPGKVKDIQWFKNRKNIISFMSKIKRGTVIPDYWDVTVAQTCGELILVGNSIEELQNECREIESEVKLEYYV